MGLADIARRVTGCRSTQETRVQSALDDVTSNICQALGMGLGGGGSSSGGGGGGDGGASGSGGPGSPGGSGPMDGVLEITVSDPQRSANTQSSIPGRKVGGFTQIVLAMSRNRELSCI